MSRLLVAEAPLLVQASLAQVIGLNEAIILQKLQFWTSHKQADPLKYGKSFIEGRWWVYNTLAEWNKQFPFWSENTVQRTLKSLLKQGLITVKTLDPNPRVRTNWYSINYDAVNALDLSAPPKPSAGARQKPAEKAAKQSASKLPEAKSAAPNLAAPKSADPNLGLANLAPNCENDAPQIGVVSHNPKLGPCLSENSTENSTEPDTHTRARDTRAAPAPPAALAAEPAAEAALVPVSGALVGEFLAFGFSRGEAEALARKYGEARCQEVLDAVPAKCEGANRRNNWVRRGLAENWRLGTPPADWRISTAEELIAHVARRGLEAVCVELRRRADAHTRQGNTSRARFARLLAERLTQGEPLADTWASARDEIYGAASPARTSPSPSSPSSSSPPSGANAPAKGLDWTKGEGNFARDMCRRLGRKWTGPDKPAAPDTVQEAAPDTAPEAASE